jgi:hypothetical protein
MGICSVFLGHEKLGYLYAVLHNAKEIFEFNESFGLKEEAIQSVNDLS